MRAYAVLALRIPESSRYLVSRGRPEEAGRVLADVTGTRDAGAVGHKVDEIVSSQRRETRPSLRDLRAAGTGLRPIVWIGILLSVFQQFVGINVIFYYSTTLWQAAGFSESDSFLASVINSLVNVGATVVAILEAVPAPGAAPSDSPVLTGAYSPIALVAANLYVVAFAISWGPVVWVLLGEMFPNWLRAAAFAVAAAAQWIANFLITVTFQALADVGLAVAYGLYTAFALLSFFVVLGFVRETKGKELEDTVAY